MATKNHFLADIICDDQDNTFLFFTQIGERVPLYSSSKQC